MKSSTLDTVEPTTAEAGAARSGPARARAIVATLDRAEKIALTTSYFPLVSPKRGELAMPLCSGFTPGIDRAGIPSLRITDASLGVSNILNMREGDTATALPSALAMGASFDADLVRAASAMIAAEARAKTFNVMLAGGINLIRDPWAGRNFEYFSEDVLLSGVLGGAAVQGVQSRHVASTLKHYVLNSQETGRMIVDARMSMPALRESDLLAFEIAIELGRPASIMTAYNKINGTWAGEHAPLINDILKGEWRFSGWVMSDWGGTHSTVEAAMAGLDQESGVELDTMLNGAIYFTDALAEAVEIGTVPEGRLDDMAARILTGMIECGAHDDPAPLRPHEVDDEAHGLVAREVAEAGIVLLKNEGGLLPLRRDLRRVAVIGGHADVGVPSGGGSSQVRSHGGAPIEVPLQHGDAAWFCRMTYHASSPLDAIRALLPDAVVHWCDGNDPSAAARLAREVDVAIVFATQWRTEAVDLDTLALPDGQEALIEAVADANANSVVVLESGGAVLMPWLRNVPAVLAAWYPGQRGGEAIARILVGEVNPSGRLPISFPNTDADMPRPQAPGRDEERARDHARAAGDDAARISPFRAEYPEGANLGYRWHESEGVMPLFPFGHGLSYTSFEYADLEVGTVSAPTVSIAVRNSGTRMGSDVIQAYVRAADHAGVATWRLAGFRRVALQPGQSRRVSVTLEPRAYSRWDEAEGTWVQDPGLELAVGRSATDLILRVPLAS